MAKQKIQKSNAKAAPAGKSVPIKKFENSVDSTQVIDYREIGASGLQRFSGFVYEEFLKELTGWKGCAVFKEMRANDATVSAIMYAIHMLVRQVSWSVEPASSQPFDIEAKDFVDTCMNDMSYTWTDTVDEILSFLTYGFSVHEIVYKRRCGDSLDPTMRSNYTDGRIGWRKIPLRSQDTIYRWQFDDHGGIQGVEQLAPPHYYHTVIPIEKMLLFRTTINKNNPEGQSILRGAYRSWYLKKNVENIEGIGVERDLCGLPVALVPPELLSKGASNEQKTLLAEVRNIVTNIRRDEQEGIVFPSAYDESGKLLYDLKLLSTGGQRQFDTDKIINRYARDIAMTCLADFLLIGHQKTGSFALVSSKTELFAVAIGAFLDIIAENFNRFAIPRLFDLNDFQISDYPRITHGDIESADLEELGKFIDSLTAAGMPMFPNAELEKRLMDIAGLPAPITPETGDLEQQIEPKPQGDAPSKVVEIPEQPIQVPTGLDVPADTTPVNGQPPQPKTFNSPLGTTETDQATAERARRPRPSGL